MNERNRTELNPSPRINRLRVRQALGVAGLLVLGIVVGSAASDAGVRRLFDRVTIENPTPPAIAVPKDGFAIIGASDDRYYLVLQDGATFVVRDGRRELCWRNGFN